MTFHVYRKGVGPIFGAKPVEHVATFDNWDDAHRFTDSKNSYWFGTYNYWITDKVY